MDFLHILLLAAGLAMDAFAVAVTSGITIKELKLRHALLIAVFFGGFQALMPFLGWLAGASAADYIKSWDHWIAFGLLAFIGGKMIYEALKNDEEEVRDPLRLMTLLVLAVATSIDALAVGITFALVPVNLPLALAVIGGVTFALSFAGVYIGRFCGHLFERKLEIAGGLILFGIGVNILWEHLA